MSSTLGVTHDTSGSSPRTDSHDADPQARCRSLTPHAPDSARRAPHALGPRVVCPVPDVPPHPRRPPRRVAPPPRRRPRVRTLHARRADGGHRRLPRHPPRGGSADPTPRGVRPPRPGAVVRVDGRVPRLRRDHRAGPPDGHRSGGRLRRGHGGRLPARHVRPHRPDAPDPAGLRLLRRRRLAGRAEGDRPHRLLVGGTGRLDGARRVPPRGLRERGDAPRRRRGPGRHGRPLRGPARRHARRPPPLDERDRPPHAPTVAGTGRRRGERHPGRVPVRGRGAGRPPRCGAEPRPAPLAGRTALRGAGQPVDGRHLEPGRRAPGGRSGRTNARTSRRAPVGAAVARRSLAGGVPRRGLAAGGPERRPRLELRLLLRRRRRRRAGPLRRSTPPRRGAHGSARSPRSPTRSTHPDRSS